MGTTNTSPMKVLCPTTTAGRTLRLVKSVNGIGRRMTSPVEKLIENIVRRAVPCLGQTFLGQSQPSFSFFRLASLIFGLNSNNDLSLILQWQRMGKLQHPVFVNCFDCGSHVLNVPFVVSDGKVDPVGDLIARIISDVLTTSPKRWAGLGRKIPSARRRRIRARRSRFPEKSLMFGIHCSPHRIPCFDGI